MAKPAGPGSDPRIWCLAIGETLIWAASLYLFPALLPYWERDLGWSKTELTAAFTGALVVSAMLSPLAGKLVDQGFGRTLLTGSTLLIALLLVTLAHMQSYTMFVMLWLAIGACMAGALYDPCFAFVMRTRGDAARRAITLITLVAGFAGTVSFPISSFVAEYGGWRLATWVFAALAIGIAAPCFWFGTRVTSSDPIVTRENPENGQIDHAFRRALGVLTFWLLGGCFALMYLNHGTVLTHLLPMLSERGIGIEYAVFTISLIGPAQVAGRLIMIVAERWLSMGTIALASMVVLILAAACLLASNAWPLLLPFAAVMQGAALGVSSIVRPVVTATLLGRESFGAIAGAIALPVMLAMAFAPSLGAALWHVAGYDMTFGINVLLAVMATAMLGLALARGPAPWVKDH